VAIKQNLKIKILTKKQNLKIKISRAKRKI
jgi:hypothetical protein